MKPINNLKEIIKEWIQLDYIDPADIPSIELYMDQVTTFMDKQLANTKRHEDDKTLTKTMINNYTKNNVLPPPVKKKYSKEHIFLLIYIYYSKSFLSISDIQHVLNPMIENFYDRPAGMEDIYEQIFNAEGKHFKNILKSVETTKNLSTSLFPERSEKDKAYLDNFAFISLLSYDIYLKKCLIEKMIDQVYIPEEEAKAKEKEKKK